MTAEDGVLPHQVPTRLPHPYMTTIFQLQHTTTYDIPFPFRPPNTHSLRGKLPQGQTPSHLVWRALASCRHLTPAPRGSAKRVRTGRMPYIHTLVTHTRCIRDGRGGVFGPRLPGLRPKGSFESSERLSAALSRYLLPVKLPVR